MRKKTLASIYFPIQRPRFDPGAKIPIRGDFVLCSFHVSCQFFRCCFNEDQKRCSFFSFSHAFKGSSTTSSTTSEEEDEARRSTPDIPRNEGELAAGDALDNEVHDVSPRF